MGFLGGSRKGARVGIVMEGFVPALAPAGIAPGPRASQRLRPAQLAWAAAKDRRGCKRALLKNAFSPQKNPPGVKWHPEQITMILDNYDYIIK